MAAKTKEFICQSEYLGGGDDTITATTAKKAAEAYCEETYDIEDGDQIIVYGEIARFNVEHKTVLTEVKK